MMVKRRDKHERSGMKIEDIVPLTP